MFALNVYAVPVFFVGASIFAIGLFIYLQNKRSPVHISFGLVCLAIATWLLSFAVIYSLRNARLALLLYRWVTFLGVANIMPSAYFFATAWHDLLSKKRKFVIAGYLVSMVFYITAVNTNLVVSSVRPFFWGFYPRYGPVGTAFLFLFCFQFAVNLSQFASAYRSEKVPVKKAQAKLMMLGFVASLAASCDFVAKVTPYQFYPFGYIPMFLLVCIVGYAIIRYRAFDIETVMHKTLMWLATSFVVIIPLVLVSQPVYPRLLSAHPLYASAWIVGLCVILLVYFRFVQPMVDQLFQRRRHNLEDASAKFAEELVHLKGLGEVVRLLEKTIKENLYAQRADIYIYDEDSKRYVLASESAACPMKEWPCDSALTGWFSINDAIINKEFLEIDPRCAGIRDAVRDYFQRLNAVMFIPLVLNEALLGIISLGRKSNLCRYNSFDYQFLMTLKSESTIAVSNSMLYDRIEEKVRRRTEELVKMQQQLIQAEKLATVGTLAGGVAHEINSPLTAIMTNVQLLVSSPANEFDRESLLLIEGAAKRCRSIIQKLMVYARKPQNADGLSMVDLAGVINNVVSFLGYQLSQENIRVVKRMNGSIFVPGIPNELEQVLTNIVINARDAIREVKREGQIEISLQRHDDRVAIEVKDDGAGIPKENISKIFDPFFTTKAVGKGTGLGLSICQAIIQRHSGSICVSSNPGEGTTFRVELPLADSK